LETVNNPSETVPGNPEGGENGAVANLRDVVAQATGRTFKSDEDALASIKQTYAYVGKVGQLEKDIETMRSQKPPTVDESKFVPREEFERATFYSKHPDLEQHAELLSSLSKTKGVSLEEASNLDSFKSVVEKARAHDEVEKSKSVLQTNQRLGQVTDKFDQAHKAMAAGDDAGAARAAVGAVLDAYGLK
jgi:hypothetical protein